MRRGQRSEEPSSCKPADDLPHRLGPLCPSPHPGCFSLCEVFIPELAGDTRTQATQEAALDAAPAPPLLNTGRLWICRDVV